MEYVKGCTGTEARLAWACSAINRVVRASSCKDKLSRVNSIASIICGGVRVPGCPECPLPVNWQFARPPTPQQYKRARAPS